VHDDGYFDERVAARYDESSAEMFDPAVVDPVVGDRGRDILGRVPRLQHDHEPDDAGGAGRVLPQRRGAPRGRRTAITGGVSLSSYLWFSSSSLA
jgi:hypothetical protein